VPIGAAAPSIEIRRIATIVERMDDGPPWIEVFRSAAPGACDERALVLEAVGIAALATRGPEGCDLRVAEADVPRARLELARYLLENRPVPRPAPPMLHGGVVPASAAYVLVLLLVAAASGHAALGFDWYGRGALDGAQLRAGEAWRALTALTLHADLAHLAANAGFGALFGGLAARLYGAGVGWLLVLVAATLANVLNAVWMPPGRVSIGASTAVFAALGAVAVFGWPAAARRTRLAWRGASLVAALVLLALLGTGDAHTDIAAHALGFAAGLTLALPLRRWPAAHGRYAQGLAGLAAALLCASAWLAALLTRGA
jgi:rhomboid protease GluP